MISPTKEDTTWCLHKQLQFNLGACVTLDVISINTTITFVRKITNDNLESIDFNCGTCSVLGASVLGVVWMIQFLHASIKGGTSRLLDYHLLLTFFCN